MRIRIVCLGLSLVLGGMVVGCGDSGPVMGTVTGMVKYDGKPLPAGTVFFDLAGKGSGGQIEADGRYTASSVHVGLNKVYVTTPPGSAPNAPKALVGTKSGPTVPIPAKYSDGKTSGLELTVKTGTQTFDINLPK